ncbi:MAG: PQQ-dependent sugar dehydrogenase [Verrucomicrobiota bacterium]
MTSLAVALRRACLSGLLCVLFLKSPAQIPYPATFQITKGGAAVVLEDYAQLPLSGRGGSFTSFGANVNLADQLARPTFIRSEPTNAPLSGTRFFVTDLNRNLYILDQTTRAFTPYLNFQSIFRRYYNSGGFAGGVNPIAFDPAYASNGLFYTAHLETNSTASATPTNSNHPNLDLTGYTTTARVNPPSGTIRYESVLVEWHDTNINNATFEGSAREILRVGLNDRIHPMGDLMFNPLAQPGDADYRNLYIAQGDGSAGENSATRTTPQRLDALQGKILRITPDLTLRPADELSANGRYRIPTTGTDTNPFVNVSLTNLKKEIFAYGFRNCHRFSWDPVANVIVEDDIGLHSWEEVNLIHKGGNYGYSEREGAEQLFVGGVNNGQTGSKVGAVFPSPDTLTVTGLVSAVTPIYPVALYSHWDGDGISSGFVYRGSLMPAMYGKYIFGDIANGRMFYADFNEMLAADDGNLNTVATTHELQIVYNNPLDTPDAGYARWRMFDIVAMTYTNRGGNAGSQRLPGSAASTGPGKTDVDGVTYGSGRVDLRLCLGGDGEIYVISKSDGSIRKLVASVGPPAILGITNNAGNLTLTWQSVPGWNYRLQYKTSVTTPDWTDVGGDVTAGGLTASKVTTLTNDAQFYRVKWLP